MNPYPILTVIVSLMNSLWTKIVVEPLTPEELNVVISNLYPNLTNMVSKLIGINVIIERD